MMVQKNTILMLVNIIFLPVLIMTPTKAFAGCDQPDAPDCGCFDDTGVWNPAGAFIQDVATQTVGTAESCVSNGGKPYYQMVLGCNDEPCALIKAWMLSFWPFMSIDKRQAWCSETISYWHRETGIPYSGGYRNCGWHCNWLNYSVGQLKTWYSIEEILFFGGRGRWMEPGEVDYEDYELGVTLPVPGAYVSWRTYDDTSDTWVSDGKSHSLMINEMWLYKDVGGKLFQVKVSLLEGNSGNQVRNTREWDDLLSVTPQGPDWLSKNKKIYGFGIDLNSSGEPVYDPSRLHIVLWPFIQSPPQTRTVVATDPVWLQYYEPYLPALSAYAELIREAGEPNVISSSPALQISGIPDGQQVFWRFPQGLPGGVEVDIDLLDVHPLPIKGVELRWGSGALPGDYRVQFASAGQQYQEATVPEMPGVNQVPSGSSIPVPAIFATTGDGMQVRYVKLIFPNNFTQDAILQELRFHYYQGPLVDTEDCPFILIGDLDHNCRVDFLDVNLMARNWLIDCLDSPGDPACVLE
ncbi:MAG: hypothetical protein FVQ85_15195 [Planctomycetes bacterium]|nr:hypothetical protein [Planctomycetota bacterium]